MATGNISICSCLLMLLHCDFAYVHCRSILNLLDLHVTQWLAYAACALYSVQAL